MSPKLIVFDCDGTLVDSQSVIVEAMSRALRDHGLKPLPREAVLSIVGLSLHEAISRLVPEATETAVQGLVQAYKSSFQILRADPSFHEPAYPHLVETIRRLATRDDILLGIATGKSVRGVSAVLDRLDLDGLFATIQTADTNPSKPSPVMLERALAETGTDPAHAVMIGDTTFDIEMAAAAGMSSIGVAWGYHPVEALRRAGATRIVGTGSDLLDTLDALLGVPASLSRPGT
jgi:phosphoglycolate phosphatase